MRLSAFDTYQMFLALKNHFTQKSYDFFKYHGKTNASQESFLARRDKYQFQKLCRLKPDNEMRDFIVANLLESDNIWVGDLLDSEAEDKYRQYLKRKQSITYMFTNDIDILLSELPNPKDWFDCSDDLPPIMSLAMNNTISLETFVILNDFVGFIDKFDKKMADDFLWPKFSIKARKFRPFVEYDRDKIKKILKEKLNV